VEASGAAFWPSKPHEHWCFRHHKGNSFNFKKEIRGKKFVALTSARDERSSICPAGEQNV
jgi:hypothetical protein